jgi:hypothetical protein
MAKPDPKKEAQLHVMTHATSEDVIAIGAWDGTERGHFPVLDPSGQR